MRAALRLVTNKRLWFSSSEQPGRLQRSNKCTDSFSQFFYFHPHQTLHNPCSPHTGILCCHLGSILSSSPIHTSLYNALPLNWHPNFTPLLLLASTLTLNSSLTTHRQHTKLIFLFKLFHNCSFFPLQIVQPCRPSSSYPLSSFHPNNI